MKIEKTIGNLNNFHGWESYIYIIDWVSISGDEMKNMSILTKKTSLGQRITLDLLNHQDLKDGDILKMNNYSIIVVKLVEESKKSVIIYQPRKKSLATRKTLNI